MSKLLHRAETLRARVEKRRWFNVYRMKCLRNCDRINNDVICMQMRMMRNLENRVNSHERRWFENVRRDDGRLINRVMTEEVSEIGLEVDQSLDR